MIESIQKKIGRRLTVKNFYGFDDLKSISLLDIDTHERLETLEKQVDLIPEDQLPAKGIEAVDSDSLLALVCLERAFLKIQTPAIASTLAFCIAKERVQFDKAVELCQSAIRMEPENTRHYLRLGQVYLMQGKKSEAIAIYMEGLKHGDDAAIKKDLALVGTRRKPVIPILRREHLLNRSLGFIIDRFCKRSHHP